MEELNELIEFETQLTNKTRNKLEEVMEEPQIKQKKLHLGKVSCINNYSPKDENVNLRLFNELMEKNLALDRERRKINLTII